MSNDGESRAVEAAREIREKTSVRKVAFASAIGATIEWYAFFLYGTAAALVFNQSGGHEIRVRAVDKTGGARPDAVGWNDLGYLYDGAVGHPAEVL
jgi:hypothetical protein